MASQKNIIAVLAQEVIFEVMMIVKIKFAIKGAFHSNQIILDLSICMNM